MVGVAVVVAVVVGVVVGVAVVVGVGVAVAVAVAVAVEVAVEVGATMIGRTRPTKTFTLEQRSIDKIAYLAELEGCTLSRALDKIISEWRPKKRNR